MPFSDDFVQNYCGFSDDFREKFIPISGSPATKSVNTSTTYNPVKTAGYRVAYVVPFSQNVPHSSPFLTVARNYEVEDLDRVEITYSEGFAAWNGTQNSLTMTVDPFTLDNDSTSDVLVEGVELILSPRYASSIVLRDLTLTRDGTIEGLPRYTYIPNLYFATGTRFYDNSGPASLYTVQSKYHQLGEVGIGPSAFSGTDTNGSTVLVRFGGVCSLARYNFNQTVPIIPGDSFPLSLGNLIINFNVTIKSC